MGEEIILCRYGEISLKGGNRHLFEGQLVNNITSYLKKEKIQFNLKKIRGRILISAEDTKKAAKCMKNIFGLTSTSIAIKTDLNMDKIKEAAFGIAKEREFSTFRVTAQRLQKLVAPSMEIEREVGSFINEKLSKKVSLKKFDLEIGVEISDFAYVFTEKTACFGGLPVGIEGKVLAFIEDDASILAAWLMMKRGCSIVPAAIKTGDISLLRRYGCYEQVSLVKGFKELAELASEKKCKALVVNQTLETFKGIDTEMAILRPLIALTGEEIKEQLEKISAGQTQK